MEVSTAVVTIVGLSPYSQSRFHNEPKLERESADAYDERTWRSKLTLGRDGSTIVIPNHGMHQALIAAAKYTGEQIAGQGKKTWTSKFTTGIAILGEISLGVPASAAQMETILANADGVRGSGKRVIRRFPVVAEWQTTFEIAILDPIITEAQLRKMLDAAGMFIGIGRFRPEKGGDKGRWRVEGLVWNDRRKLAA